MKPPRPPLHAPATGLATLCRRVRVHMGLKAFGTTVGMCAFFVGYFALLRHPSGPVAIMPRTWLDQVVPFQPWTLAPYLSLWLYLSLAPALMVDRRQLWSFAGGCLGLSLAGYAFYYFFPTALPPTDIDWTQHPFFQFLKNTDASGNACPSLHAAFAVFTALWFARILPAIGAGRITQGLNLLWALLIVYSTVATRQHVTLDALFGVALGALVASLNFIAAPCREAVTATPRPLFFAVVAIKLSALLLWTSGVPLTWSFALFLSGGALVLWALFAPNAQGVVPVFTRFHTPRPEFWLTLDDGPDPDDTPRLLALLAQHHARATFFLIGERASRHPELVAAILRAGHEVAHHTHTHPRLGLWAYSRAELAAELDRASAVFAAAGAPPPRRFRAPMGIKNLGLHRALAARGLVCIGWSLRSHDSFATDPAAVAARVLRRLRPGRIVVMHEGPFLAPSVRVEAVRQVLAGASDRGLRAIIPTGDQLG